MPEFALFGVEGRVEAGGDHVFNTNKAGRVGGSVVDEALANIGAQVRAIVVSFYDAAGIGGVDVEGI